MTQTDISKKGGVAWHCMAKQWGLSFKDSFMVFFLSFFLWVWVLEASGWAMIRQKRLSFFFFPFNYFIFIWKSQLHHLLFLPLAQLACFPLVFSHTSRNKERKKTHPIMAIHSSLMLSIAYRPALSLSPLFLFYILFSLIFALVCFSILLFNFILSKGYIFGEDFLW